MSDFKKNIAILGSTGSIGVQCLKVIEKKPNNFKAFLLSANSNHELLYQQAKKHSPKHIVINTETGYRFLKKNLGENVAVWLGEQALCALMSDPEIDFVVSSIVGSAGLLPTLKAIRAKKNIGLANKETLVVAGDLIMAEAERFGVSIIPIDSEHSAIFQCLVGEKSRNINRLILTASGGPFLNKPEAEFHSITVENALKHPNWEMGKKISIDSATLMNKGLEVIEARWLFDVHPKQIETVIHPESIIHSLVEFSDGSIKAELGFPEMTIPILYAMSFPDRLNYNIKTFKLENIGSLSFHKTNKSKFRHLQLAYDALDVGGTAPCALNASNEVAVEAFLNRKIVFTDMIKVIDKSMENYIFVKNPELKDYLLVDKETREMTKTIISTL